MTSISIIIPCYNEVDVISSIQSIADCIPPRNEVTVIVVVNGSEWDSEAVLAQNQTSITELEEWKSNSEPGWLKLLILNISHKSKKIAGVGNARKIGMDYAYALSANPKKQVLVCYDADCTCSSDYLVEIEKAFAISDTDLATIYFEHDMISSQAIVDYELFLRYHFQGLRSTGYPYAFQTIGSSMAVRGNVYQQFGGMNQRKAGEDFYFLHKLIPYRNVVEINSCTVFPSSRESDRVPFGTGNAVDKYNESTCKTYYTYHPDIYAVIGLLIKAFQETRLETELSLEHLPLDIAHFLNQENFINAFTNFRKQSKTDHQLQTNLFRWLNGPRMLKLVHHLRDKAFMNIPINGAVSLFWETQFGEQIDLTNRDWLKKLRRLEKD